MRAIRQVLGCFAVIAFALPGCTEERAPVVTPAGAPTSPRIDTLRTGAEMLQANAPVSGMNLYLVGFHPMKEDPANQMEVHHFCRQVNEDFAQCALFDGNTANANLTGVEFIISEKMFEALPEDERKFWHPHNGEILSGQLVAPGIPDIAEKDLMRSKLNSYGKTWHVWMTDRGHRLPLGPPMLAWSFNRDGEAKPGLVEERDKKMGIDSAAKRRERLDLAAFARPQSGVADLKARFPGPTQALPGVVDADHQEATREKQRGPGSKKAGR
ncbi:MAG TPA: OBAP family protein [Burkholderiales bacterium]|nr:OBAP family protein [Burkholderiales bacterium]